MGGRFEVYYYSSNFHPWSSIDKTTIAFPRVIVPFYILTRNLWEFFVPCLIPCWIVLAPLSKTNWSYKSCLFCNTLSCSIIFWSVHISLWHSLRTGNVRPLYSSSQKCVLSSTYCDFFLKIINFRIVLSIYKTVGIMIGNVLNL